MLLFLTAVAVAVVGGAALPSLPVAFHLLQTGAVVLEGLPVPDWAAVAAFPALSGRFPRLAFDKAKWARAQRPA